MRVGSACEAQGEKRTRPTTNQTARVLSTWLRFKKTDLLDPFKLFLKYPPSLKINIFGFKGLLDSLRGFPRQVMAKKSFS
jgi:hypothetical protein